MLKGVAMSMVQGSIYSVLLGTTYKAFIDKDWDMAKLPALSAFWTGIVIPSGIGWSIVNNKALKALSLPKDPIGLIKNFNGKFIAADLVLNHILYQAFLATVLNYFLGTVSYERTKAQNKLNSKDAYKAMSIHFQNIQRDLFVKRMQITAASLLIDIFASRLIRQYRTGSKLVFLKVNVLNFCWHQYLIYKIESNPAFKALPAPDETEIKP